MAEETFLLDSKKLLKKIEESELKRWWIAEQLAVDRITVSRWLSGRIKKIKASNLDRLAEILDCKREEFITSREPIVGASKRERMIAAEAIIDQDLVQLVSPTESFALAEKIMKAIIHPDMPAKILSQLYLKTSSCLWRQQKFNEAKKFVRRAIEMAQDDDLIEDENKARFHYGLLETLSGNVTHGKEIFEQVISEVEDPPIVYHANHVLCNALFYIGHIHESSEKLGQLLNQAMPQEIESSKQQIILGTKWGFFCDVLFEVGDLKAANEANQKSKLHAQNINHEIILINATLRHAEFLARTGSFKEAIQHYEEGIQAAEDKDLTPSIFYLHGARVYRLAGDYKKAIAVTEQALKKRNDPPVRGSFWMERRNILLLSERLSAAQSAQKKASQIYRNYGMSARYNFLKTLSDSNTNAF